MAVRALRPTAYRTVTNQNEWTFVVISFIMRACSLEGRAQIPRYSGKLK